MDSAKDFIDFSNSLLILKVYRSIEMRNLLVRNFAQNLCFAWMNHESKFYDKCAVWK